MAFLLVRVGTTRYGVPKRKINCFCFLRRRISNRNNFAGGYLLIHKGDITADPNPTGLPSLATNVAIYHWAGMLDLEALFGEEASAFLPEVGCLTA